ncbi:(+)-delta-cadinene synthase isozyme A-like [Herrania umbratica]|uniref:(+)-delta-cadinene synthase isozyme A-like n=1 Tax=Herrania umbratica TaxID=108875 RepID=A0A6J1AJK3_9ROSI|nr:(+)-delta-cadinene synthase isozyme A-like [Herrania umbratica]
MASQVSQVLASTHNAISSNMENRPKADFHPGIWGDVFLTCPDKDIDATTELQYEELKEEVRRMLVAPMDNSNQKLPLIDAIFGKSCRSLLFLFVSVGLECMHSDDEFKV